MRRRGWMCGSVIREITASGGRIELAVEGGDCRGEDCGGCDVRGIAACCCGCLVAVGVAPGGGA